MIKLEQGQLWKAGEEYLRIVDLQRLEVKHKAIRNLETGEGTHHYVTKKQFCRLLKNAAVVSSEGLLRKKVDAHKFFQIQSGIEMINNGEIINSNTAI